MKARVIQDRCIGCELCASEYPEAFVMDENGLAVAKDVDGLEDSKLIDTMYDCPVVAIEVA
jgi:ferredoxin